MRKKEIYSITDMKGYCERIAQIISNEFNTKNPNEVYNFVSLEQINKIVEEKCIYKNEMQQFLLDEKKHAEIVNSVMQIVQNTAIAQLAAQGFLECAWDEELNDMVFWLPEGFL